MVVGETPDNEENGEEGETNKLKRLTTDSVNGSNSEPVTRNGTRAHENAITGREVVELLVDSVSGAVANGLEDSR